MGNEEEEKDKNKKSGKVAPSHFLQAALLQEGFQNGSPNRISIRIGMQAVVGIRGDLLIVFIRKRREEVHEQNALAFHVGFDPCV